MKCEVCNSGEFEKLFPEKNIERCKKCGLIFANPMPSDKEIREFYNKGFFSPTEYYKRLEKSDRKRFDDIYKDVSKFLKSGNFLDVGCSTGNFLLFAYQKSWNVYGIEINKKSVEECRRKFKNKKLNIINDMFSAESFSGKKFDWINLGDVIEHVKEPKKMLEILNRKLRKNGIITLTTPDINNWFTRRFQIKPDEHLFYFSKKTIKYLLELCGFEILVIKNYSPYRNLSSLAYSSTFSKSPVRYLFNLLGFFGNFIITLPFKDEIFVVARKSTSVDAE